MSSNILEEVLLTKSENEICELYRQMKEDDPEIASRLRSAFIVREFLHNDWMSRNVANMVQLEMLMLNSVRINSTENEWEAIKYIFNNYKHKDFTGINTLLLAKLHIENRLPDSSSNPELFFANRVSNELKLFNYEGFFSDFYFTLTKMIVSGIDSVKEFYCFLDMLNEVEDTLPEYKGFKSLVSEYEGSQQQKSNLNHYLEVVEREYKVLQLANDPVESHFEGVRNTMITMIIFYWSIGDLDMANLLLYKTLSLINEDSRYYLPLKFIEKEINL